MRRARISVTAALLAALLPAVAGAQGDAAPREDPGGAIGRLLGDLLERIDPYLRDLADLMGDVSGWHAPEVLPNGDILIRRRHPPEGAVPSEPPAEGPVTEPFEL